MQCPGCGQPAVRVRDRLLAAARAEARCPACGVVIRFGFWPRLAHVVFGDLLLLAGVGAAFYWQAPFFVVLSAGSWISLAVLLPLDAAHDGDGAGKSLHR